MMQPAPSPLHSEDSAERVLVTGASGFIGTRLVSRLHGQGVPVLATDIVPPRQTLPGVYYLGWDVRHSAPESLSGRFARIYNLAAVHRTPGHPAHDYYETNVLGATNVTALAHAAGVKEIVFTSSISVYGPSEQLMTEATEPSPVSAYGHSKRMAELIHQAWVQQDEERRLVIARPGVVFGPGERGNYSHLAHALSRGLFLYPGRKTTVKSGGYVDELLDTFQFATGQADRQVTFNFAYPQESTIEDIVHAFSDVRGFRRNFATAPVAPLYIIAGVFETANRLGLRNPIHRERILKLVRSTRVEPGWLRSRGYDFHTNLQTALAAWADETDGTFA